MNKFKRFLSTLGNYLGRINRRVLVVIVVVIVGVVTLIVSQASTTSTSIEPENGTKSGVATISSNSASGGSAIRFTQPGQSVCGKFLTNYDYQVPFGNAIWNQPVCDLPLHPRSADYANRFLEWGHVNDGSASADSNNGKIGASPGYPGPPTIIDPDGLASLFSREVYYASDATMESQVASILYTSNLDGVGYNENEALPKANSKSQHPNNRIPWNPAWKTGMAGDNEIFILDDRPGPNEGRIYTIWGYLAGGCVADAWFFPNRVCGNSIQIGRGHNGSIIDYRTHEGYVSERGVGLSYYATLTTPDEVKAGEIRHALGISIPNTSFGAVCTTAQQGTTAEGNTCGTAVAPASKFEWANAPAPPVMREPFKSLYTISRTIPEGMRFAISITDDQITDWINSRPALKANIQRARTARIIARAMRDYGMIVVDTNGQRPDIQMVGGVNPEHRAKWIELGMGPEHKDDLLDGLVNSNNLRVINPPTATCANGTTSKYFCKWTDMRY